MKKILLYFFLLILPISLFGQVRLSWSERWSKPATESSVFTIDQYGNVYLTNREVLYKIDSSGTVLFQQSNKDWSTLRTIDARNPMKILLFSEDQQLIEFLDNTLSSQQDLIDLSQEGFSMVTDVTASAQPNKIWIFDSDNSRLTLFTRQVSQQQKIDNIYGLLNTSNITEIDEFNAMLFLLDPTKGVFILDRYGTLLDFIKITGVQKLHLEDTKLFYLQNGQLFFMDLRDKLPVQINLPISGIRDFEKLKDRFYFLTDHDLEVFSFQNK